MIIDSSAIVAYLRNERSAEAIENALSKPVTKLISAGTLLEAYIVIDRQGETLLSLKFESFLGLFGFEVVPVTESQVKIARAAYRDFGKGSGHPAQLNFGDCFAYALAYERGEPLLCVGDDFASTDLELVNLEEIDEAEDD